MVLYLNGSYLGGHFFLDPLNPVILQSTKIP